MGVAATGPWHLESTRGRYPFGMGWLGIGPLGRGSRVAAAPLGRGAEGCRGGAKLGGPPTERALPGRAPSLGRGGAPLAGSRTAHGLGGRLGRPRPGLPPSEGRRDLGPQEPAAPQGVRLRSDGSDAAPLGMALPARTLGARRKRAAGEHGSRRSPGAPRTGASPPGRTADPAAGRDPRWARGRTARRGTAHHGAGFGGHRRWQRRGGSRLEPPRCVPRRGTSSASASPGQAWTRPPTGRSFGVSG